MDSMTFKPRIGLDLDGVVVDWTRKVLEMFNARSWGSSHPYNFDPAIEPPYWDWIKDQVRPGDWTWLWNDGMRESYSDALPYAGAQRFAYQLRKLGDIIVMTSRPEGTWTDTIEWWKKHMAFTPAGYNFFRDGKEKGNVKCDYLIEDNAEYAETYKICTPTATVLLFDRAWNRDAGEWALGLERVHSYDEVLRTIREDLE